MAIRWDEFPHNEIRLKIYARLGYNAAARSAEDSLRHILQRRLPSLKAVDHRRFIELEASGLVEHLRCTRDIYQEFVNKHNCHPVLEAHWVVLRCAVFPTAIALLREQVIKYARPTRVPGRDLSILFGIPTRTCYKDVRDGIGFLSPPDLDDETPATDTELQSLGKLVDDSLLLFRDIRAGGAVFQFYGGGPFATDDRRSLDNSWSLCALRQQITLIDWMGIREKLWHLCSPWTDGLVSLFACVQEELMSQWRALPSDSLVHELELGKRSSRFRSIVVPARRRTPAEEAVREALTISSSPERRRPGRKPKLPIEFIVCAGTLWRKAISGAGPTVPDDQLREIAVALDESGYLPPAAYLEGKCALEVKSFNSRNSNSKIGPLRTWLELVSRGDKDHLRGMRRLLSRCSKRLSAHSLSGN